MARLAVRALDDDPDTDAVLLVSKPPSPDAAERCWPQCGTTPAVAVFLGLPDARAQSGGVQRVPHAGGRVRSRRCGWSAGRRRRPAAGLRGSGRCGGGSAGPRPARTVRGLFSGGTLCYEAQLILERPARPGVLQRAAAPSSTGCPRRTALTCCSTSARRSTREACRTR